MRNAGHPQVLHPMASLPSFCIMLIFIFFFNSQKAPEKILPPACPALWLRVVGWTLATRSSSPLSGIKTWKKAEQLKQASSLSINNFKIFSAYGHGEFGATSVSSRITVALHIFIPICLKEKDIFSSSPVIALHPPHVMNKFYQLAFISLLEIAEFFWNSKVRASGYEECHIFKQTSIHDKSLSALWNCEHPHF